MKVTVISCSPDSWLQSSRTMGDALSDACGADSVDVVTADGFSTFRRAFLDADGCLIIHTHGSSRSLSDESNGKKTRTVSLWRLLTMKPNRRIRFVFITACECAGGNRKRNLAAAVSRKIAKNGAVIANMYRVVGASRDFAAADVKNGWILYRNGREAIGEAELPASLSVKNAYEISQK